MRFEGLAEQSCSISRSLALLGDRWTLAVVKQAFARTRRFEDFLSALGISRALLSDRLKRLWEAGVLEKVRYESNRPRHEYRLTNAGLALYPILQAIRQWGDDHLAPDGAPLIYGHRGCTGTATVAMQCSRCGEPLSAHDVDVLPGPGLHAQTRGATSSDGKRPTARRRERRGRSPAVARRR
jgi:DNA-binding HxlR family transcriptional regulator